MLAMHRHVENVAAGCDQRRLGIAAGLYVRRDHALGSDVAGDVCGVVQAACAERGGRQRQGPFSCAGYRFAGRFKMR
jgi:hypothetical protein